MYLHRMTIQALGPFVGQHTIEFGDLAASGLFLLEGPTGAGKSTLIDAIVFALYGKVASPDASEDRLRSAHAAPEVETFVDLVLETGAGIYRVRRSPAYQRPKQRGSGTTLQQSQVRLWRLTSPDALDGDVMSIRADEAGAELRRAVGLDREQFVQTIVLPQGEFASFLRADPESRRGLLQQVFGTEVYERLQQRLERMRAEVGRAVEEGRQSVDRAVARFVGAAAPEEGHPVRSAGPDTAADEAGSVCLALDAAAGRAAEAAAAAQEAAEQARLEHERRRRLTEVIARRERALAELAALESSAAQHAEDDARLAAGRRVLPVLPLLAAVGPAEQALDEARQAVATARAASGEALRGLVDEAGAADVVDGGVASGPDGAAAHQAAVLGAERDRCTAERASISRALGLESGLDARAATLEASTRAAQAAAEAMAAARAELDARPEQRAALEESRTRAAGVAAGLEPALSRLAAAQERCAASREAERLAAEVAEGERLRAAAVARATAAVEETASLQRARIAGMAGELAEQLADGEPCPVCGATSHPAPATRIDPVDDADLAAAEERRAVATAAVATAATALERLRERLEQRSAAAGATSAELDASLLAAQEAVAAARSGTADLERAEAALLAFDSASRSAEQDLSARLRAADVDAERRTAAAAELDRDRAEVLAARGTADSVAARVAELDRTAAEAAAWMRALDTLRQARDTERLARSALAETMAEQGLADLEQVRSARLAPAELARLEASVEQHRLALARAREVLAEPEVLAVGSLAEVDLAGAAAAMAQTAATAQERAAESARATHRATEAALALDAVQGAVLAYRREAAEAAPVVRMANLAGAATADNTRQLTLATYVLGRRFDDLVLAANARLVTMSDGRYELIHSERREDVSTRKKGLALAVLDHRTETTRDPRTLSGGETFYVSLCLALGLADVVTAEAGGIDLGTLFVDEGFGSLDPETLDVVLAELSRLRDGGRVVGVVSHVETLKSAIAERIEVRRRADGTSTLTVRA